MILKPYEISKINIKKNNIILFYGNNEVYKNEQISEVLLKNSGDKISNYDEKEILNNQDSFLEDILSKSLFGERPETFLNHISTKGE